MQEVIVGRQPIFNRDRDVVAYELLFRSNAENQANVIDGDVATGQVLLNALVEIGLDNLVGSRLAYINFTRRFLMDENLLPPDKSRIVLEVLEDIEPDDEFVAALERVSLAGYRIALDDFVFAEKYRPLVKLANTVKLDVRALGQKQLQENVKVLRDLGVKELLAEKVETLDEFEFCKGLGIDLFQGYFLSKPKIISGKTVPSNRMVTLQLLAQLQDPKVRLEQLETIISRDVTLCFKLLHSVNSSAMGLRRKVESIRQAIMLLGFDRLRMLVSLISLSGFTEAPKAMMATALVRAKMCELLGTELKREDSSSFYLAGLFSMLEILLSRPLSEVIGALHLTDDVKEAILNHEGLIGDALCCVIAVERVEWDGTGALGLTPDQIQQAYFKAIAAADQSQAAVSETASP
ncbi:MAG: HDOD domain-containing protein [Planctomycetaceae bacterium]|nr:HDOD domain-containing protein [Planctomycetaceae bacterium]